MSFLLSRLFDFLRSFGQRSNDNKTENNANHKCQDRSHLSIVSDKNLNLEQPKPSQMNAEIIRIEQKFKELILDDPRNSGPMYESDRENGEDEPPWVISSQREFDKIIYTPPEISDVFEKLTHLVRNKMVTVEDPRTKKYGSEGEEMHYNQTSLASEISAPDQKDDMVLEWIRMAEPGLISPQKNKCGASKIPIKRSETSMFTRQRSRSVPKHIYALNNSTNKKQRRPTVQRKVCIHGTNNKDGSSLSIVQRCLLDTKLADAFKLACNRRYRGNIIDVTSHVRWMRQVGIAEEQEGQHFRKYAKKRSALNFLEYKCFLVSLSYKCGLDYFELVAKLTGTCLEVGDGPWNGSSFS